MPPIYKDQPTKLLMTDWAKGNLTPNQIFSKSDAIRWFAEHYPKIKRNTVAMHVEGMSINNRVRKHHPNVKPGSGHDLFYKLGSDQYRLWNSETDGHPLYKLEMEKKGLSAPPDEEVDGDGDEASGAFAYERDLQNYLVKNLNRIEPGLRLYEEEEITGVEFPAGGRFIDILAIDNQGSHVVFELKVSRGYDRVIGQLLRYMTWVEQNMENSKPVRGIIVAKEITNDLRLAASRIPSVRLIEYELDFKLRPLT
jgi:endonuclease